MSTPTNHPRQTVTAAQLIRQYSGPQWLVEPVSQSSHPDDIADELATINDSMWVRLASRDLRGWPPYTAIISVCDPNFAGRAVDYLVRIEVDDASNGERRDATIARQAEDIDALRTEIEGWAAMHERQVARDNLHNGQMAEMERLHANTKSAHMHAMRMSHDAAEAAEAETMAHMRAIIDDLHIRLADADARHDSAQRIAVALREEIDDNEQSINALLTALALSQANVETKRAEIDQVRRELVASRTTVTAMLKSCRDCASNDDNTDDTDD